MISREDELVELITEYLDTEGTKSQLLDILIKAIRYSDGVKDNDHEAVQPRETMDKITKEWLEQALIILKKKSSRHKLQDCHYWFICPEETIDNVIIRAIEKALNCSRIDEEQIDNDHEVVQPRRDICKLTIETALKQEEDLDLLCNSLNAQAGRFNYSDPALRCYLLRAQAAINSLCEMLKNKQRLLIGVPDNRNKTGKWIKNRFHEDSYTCSECAIQTSNKYWYCPGCGAKMDMEEVNQNARKDIET